MYDEEILHAYTLKEGESLDEVILRELRKCKEDSIRFKLGEIQVV